MLYWLKLFLFLSIFVSTSGSFRHRDKTEEVEKESKKTLPDIYWNTSNPLLVSEKLLVGEKLLTQFFRFHISNTDHIIDVNTASSGRKYDRINIVCPHSGNGSMVEKHIIYNVNKEEYETCRITNTEPRVIAYCTDPKYKLFTITFRAFSPLPSGLEFRPGKDYFFISTSSPEDVKQKSGGYCQTNNMRVVFKVAQTKNFRASEARHRGANSRNKFKKSGLKNEIPQESISETPKVMDHQTKSLDNINHARKSFRTFDNKLEKFYPLHANGNGCDNVKILLSIFLCLSLSLW